MNGGQQPRSVRYKVWNLLLLNQREPAGVQQCRDRVDLGPGGGVVRVRPHHGGGVVEAVQLGRGLGHGATRRADRVRGER